MGKVNRGDVMDYAIKVVLLITAVVSVGYLRSRVANYGFLCGVGDRLIPMDACYVLLMLWFELTEFLRKKMAVFDCRYRLTIVVRCFEVNSEGVTDHGQFTLGDSSAGLRKTRNKFLRFVFVVLSAVIAAYAIVLLPWTDTMALKACGLGAVGIVAASLIMGVVMLHDYRTR